MARADEECGRIAPGVIISLPRDADIGGVLSSAAGPADA
jgi:hypothetical protein